MASGAFVPLDVMVVAHLANPAAQKRVEGVRSGRQLPTVDDRTHVAGPTGVARRNRLVQINIANKRPLRYRRPHHGYRLSRASGMASLFVTVCLPPNASTDVNAALAAVLQPFQAMRGHPAERDI